MTSKNIIYIYMYIYITLLRDASFSIFLQKEASLTSTYFYTVVQGGASCSKKLKQEVPLTLYILYLYTNIYITYFRYLYEKNKVAAHLTFSRTMDSFCN